MLRIRKIADFQERFVSKSLQNSSFFQVAVSCIFLQEPQRGKLCGTARYSRSNVLAEQLSLAACETLQISFTEHAVYDDTLGRSLVQRLDIRLYIYLNWVKICENFLHPKVCTLEID